MITIGYNARKSLHGLFDPHEMHRIVCFRCCHLSKSSVNCIITGFKQASGMYIKKRGALLQRMNVQAKGNRKQNRRDVLGGCSPEEKSRED